MANEKDRTESPEHVAGGHHGRRVPGEEAVAVFTTREAARRYVEQVGWSETDEVGEPTPSDLADWLGEARGDGVRLVVIDPDRERQLAGEPQQVLIPTGPAQELTDVLARPPAVA